MLRNGYPLFIVCLCLFSVRAGAAEEAIEFPSALLEGRAASEAELIREAFAKGPDASPKAKETLKTLYLEVREGRASLPKAQYRIALFGLIHCRAARQVEELFLQTTDRSERAGLSAVLGQVGDTKTEDLIRKKLLPREENEVIRLSLTRGLSLLGDPSGGEMLLREMKEKLVAPKPDLMAAGMFMDLIRRFDLALAKRIWTLVLDHGSVKKPWSTEKMQKLIADCEAWWKEFGAYVRSTRSGQPYPKLYLEAKLCDLSMGAWLGLAPGERAKRIGTALKPRGLSLNEWAAMRLWERTGLWTETPWRKPPDLPDRVVKLKEAGALEARISACVLRPAFGEEDDLEWLKLTNPELFEDKKNAQRNDPGRARAPALPVLPEVSPSDAFLGRWLYSPLPYAAAGVALMLLIVLLRFILVRIRSRQRVRLR